MPRKEFSLPTSSIQSPPPLSKGKPTRKPKDFDADVPLTALMIAQVEALETPAPYLTVEHLLYVPV